MCTATSIRIKSGARRGRPDASDDTPVGGLRCSSCFFDLALQLVNPDTTSMSFLRTALLRTPRVTLSTRGLSTIEPVLYTANTTSTGSRASGASHTAEGNVAVPMGLPKEMGGTKGPYAAGSQRSLTSLTPNTRSAGGMSNVSVFVPNLRTERQADRSIPTSPTASRSNCSEWPIQPATVCCLLALGRHRMLKQSSERARSRSRTDQGREATVQGHHRPIAREHRQGEGWNSRTTFAASKQQRIIDIILA